MVKWNYNEGLRVRIKSVVFNESTFAWLHLVLSCSLSVRLSSFDLSIFRLFSLWISANVQSTEMSNRFIRNKNPLHGLNLYFPHLCSLHILSIRPPCCLQWNTTDHKCCSTLKGPGPSLKSFVLFCFVCLFVCLLGPASRRGQVLNATSDTCQENNMYIFAFFVLVFYVKQKSVRKSYFHSETKTYSVECLCYYWKSTDRWFDHTKTW